MRVPAQPPTDPVGFKAERNSAFILGVLHFFVVVAAWALLWDSQLIDRRNLAFWTAAEAMLGVASLVAFVFVLRDDPPRFVVFSRLESFGAAIVFAALPWLGADLAETTPSKHILIIAMMAVTSVSAANSSHITRRRPFFARLVVIVAASYTVAFGISGEWVFACITVMWCLAIGLLTRVGYQSSVELLELRKASEQTARHDDLTGLLSRAAFFDELGFDASASTERPAPALVLFDLDGFKGTNDGFGHAAGDAVLQAVASRLKVFLPGGTALGRLGGDEFAAIIPKQPIPFENVIAVAAQAIAEPVQFGGTDLFIAASAGWTLVESGAEPAELMEQADIAMYQCKNSATATITGFNRDLRAELDEALELRQRFRTAVKTGRIHFRAQPLVRAADRAPVAVEMLARWPMATGELDTSSELNRAAGETGLAVELDRQVLAAAADLLRDWAADPVLGSLRVKVNVTPVHLHHGGLIRSVKELVPAHLRPRLGLEFVESQLIPPDAANQQQLQELLDMDVALSIDDFGIGYSSLTYLRALPFSEIKIDRSFVSSLDTDPVNRGLVSAIVDIASALGLATVAEGVETEAELHAATELGVSYVQGYIIGRPMTIDAATDAIRSLHAAAQPPL